jgi:Fe-S-cluster containining protein
MSLDYLKPSKLSFPASDTVQPWLPILLDAYYIVDKGIAEAIKKERKKKRKLACSKGCSNCCKTHQTIPVYPLELVGISWYSAEKISGRERALLKNQLRSYSESEPCPFLLNGCCLIHPVRPISCRQFIVFGEQCSENEDPYYSRPMDILPPVKKHIDRAFFIMLPFYGVSDTAEKMKIIRGGTMHALAKLMQTCNWKSLADRMDDFETRS